MKTFKKVQKEVDEVDEIICNCCGNSCHHTINTFGDYNVCGLNEAIVEGTCGSIYLEDGKAYVFSLCEKCLSELFNKFKHQPEIYDHI